MTTTVNVTVGLTFTSESDPPGSPVAAYVYCKLVQGTLTVASKMVPAPFPDTVVFAVSPGDYTFTAQVQDSGAHPIGALFSEALTVPTPPPVVNPIVSGATFSFS
jgi:hypothetical protein